MDGKRLLLTMIMTAGLISCCGVIPVSLAQEAIRMVTNYPNPFDSRLERTTIIYRLAADATVKVKIYDLLGNLVREFPSSHERAGEQQLIWDGTDNSHCKVAKGGYVCIVEIGGENMRYVACRKIGVIH